MADLITIAQYEAIIGTITKADARTLVSTYLIPAASQAIERFVDRSLAATTYVEWVKTGNTYGVFFPEQYPLLTLYSVNKADTVFTVSNTGTQAMVVIVQPTMLQAYNPLTNVAVSYAYSTYTSIGLLLAQLATDYPLLVTEATVDTSMSTTLLRPATIAIQGGALSSVQGAIVAMTGHVNADRIVYGSEFAGSWNTMDFPGLPLDSVQYGNVGHICLVYSAGYSPLPSDLIVTTANIVRDMLAVEQGKRATGVKSESVSQYSYTLLDSIDFDNIVGTKYAGALRQYRRIVFA